MAVILERNRFWRLVLWLNHEKHVNLWYFTWDLSILLPRTHAWEACERHNRHLLAFFVSRSCHKWKQMWPCHARRWQCGRVAWVTCYMLDINRSLMMVQHVFLGGLEEWMDVGTMKALVSSTWGSSGSNRHKLHCDKSGYVLGQKDNHDSIIKTYKIVQNLNLEEGQEIEQFLRDLRHGFIKYLNLALIEIVYHPCDWSGKKWKMKDNNRFNPRYWSTIAI